jgi:hypothetical protein
MAYIRFAQSTKCAQNAKLHMSSKTTCARDEKAINVTRDIAGIAEVSEILRKQ